MPELFTLVAWKRNAEDLPVKVASASWTRTPQSFILDPLGFTSSEVHRIEIQYDESGNPANVRTVVAFDFIEAGSQPTLSAHYNSGNVLDYLSWNHGSVRCFARADEFKSIVWTRAEFGFLNGANPVVGFKLLEINWPGGPSHSEAGLPIVKATSSDQALGGGAWTFLRPALQLPILEAAGVVGWRKKLSNARISFVARDGAVNPLAPTWLWTCTADLVEDGAQTRRITPLHANAELNSTTMVFNQRQAPDAVEEQWRVLTAEEVSGSTAVSSRAPIRWDVWCDEVPGDLFWGRTDAQNTLEWWNRHVTEPYLAALHVVQDGRPISVVPRWGSTTEDPPPASGAPPILQLRFQVLDAAVRKAKLSASDYIPHRDYQSTHYSRIGRSPLDGNLGIGRLNIVWSDSESHAITRVGFPAFLNHKGKAHVRRVRITTIANEPPGDGRPRSGKWSEGSLSISFKELKPIQGAVDSLRIGSLDVSVPTKGSDAGEFPGRAVALMRGSPDAPDRTSQLVSLGVDLSWPVSRLLAGGQDPLPEEAFAPTGNRMSDLLSGEASAERIGSAVRENRFRREQPVVFSLDVQRTTATADVFFKLRCAEAADEAFSQTLQLNLLGADAARQGFVRNLDDAAPHRVLVLDRQPLLLSLLELPKVGLEVENDQEFGAWYGGQSNGSSWLLAGFTQGFDSYLPTQGVGEAFERRDSNDETEDIETDEVVDFRFSPAARLRLRTSDVDRNLTEAPWNLRRILHFTGGPSAGALLDHFDFEMLYALWCHVDAPNLRIVELCSRVGQILGRLPETPPWQSLKFIKQAYRNRHLEEWSILYNQFLSRLAVLEPWRDGQSGPMSLVDGVHFRLRSTSHLRYSPSMPSSQSQPPSVPTSPLHLANRPPHTPHGLAGGAAWGFENDASYGALWRNPVANAGLLIAPYLSILGGWGGQKAWFDNRRATVEADVAQGRVHYYATKRVGCIGRLKNRCNLVSIYERRPTRINLLDPENPQSQPWQDEHNGREIVRLVAKYVNVLERRRSYPDFGGPAVANGFVRSSHFETDIIDVMGVQEEVVSVGGVTYGFKVRLPGGAKKPKVNLELDVDPGRGFSTVELPIDNTETLYFYSDTRPEFDDDTDRWPPIPTVDFPVGTALSIQPPQIDTIDPGSPDAILPANAESERPASAAFQDFTFKLRNVSEQINVVSNRTAEAISAVIENLTLVRDPATVGRNAAMTLLRAYGNPPNVPGLKFNRPKLGYYFVGTTGSVDITPSAGLVNRADELRHRLQPLSLRVPTTSLTDKLVPRFDLPQFSDLSQLLPDFAGLKLENLFSGIKMPTIGSDRVQVTQGVDRQSQRAWLQIDINVPLSKRASVFSLGPVELCVDQANLFAKIHMDVDASGKTTRTVNGRITADWILHIGGQDLVLFADTVLSFENDGKLKFALRPENIQLSALLAFLTDLLKTLASDDGGFSLEPIEQLGAIIGVRTILDLPLPDMQFGAFGISGLRLGSLFELQAGATSSGEVDFVLALGLTLGRKTTPFTLTVLFLNGGGWFQVRAIYRPLADTRRIETSVTIGALVGAGLGLSIGPVSGFVCLQFGVSGQFESGGDQGDILTISILMLLRGHAEVLGLVSIDLNVLLQAGYNNSTGALIGTGTLSIRVKICMFFTLKFQTAVEYKFMKGSSSSRYLTSLSDASKHYVWMLS